ncbi:hypothetical protein [Rhizobium sp. NXC24]|uniref:hypothetical protein n=1 Tax=Rhizobium sp. NXC24 TaxID=2048897 RepID=UPI000CDF38A2|nr:hypothetical protein [Rhizobium sp. NXC24]AVA25776.1 hypothetical protein NXC24_PC01342 [Rhizobium sp. NXC24]
MTAVEAPSRIETARIENPSCELVDLALEIVAKVELLGRAFHAETAAQLARTVRIMKRDGRGNLSRKGLELFTGWSSASASTNSIIWAVFSISMRWDDV